MMDAPKVLKRNEIYHYIAKFLNASKLLGGIAAMLIISGQLLTDKFC